MHRNPAMGIGLLVGLVCVAVWFGVAMVNRSAAMRELLVEYERLQSVRDSLEVENLESRLELVSTSRPDRVYRALLDRGFVVPDDTQMRFLLYPRSIPEGHGGLTRRLIDLVTPSDGGCGVDTVGRAHGRSRSRAGLDPRNRRAG